MQCVGFEGGKREVTRDRAGRYQYVLDDFSEVSQYEALQYPRRYLMVSCSLSSILPHRRDLIPSSGETDRMLDLR